MLLWAIQSDAWHCVIASFRSKYFSYNERTNDTRRPQQCPADDTRINCSCRASESVPTVQKWHRNWSGIIIAKARSGSGESAKRSPWLTEPCRARGCPGLRQDEPLDRRHRSTTKRSWTWTKHQTLGTAHATTTSQNRCAWESSTGSACRAHSHRAPRSWTDRPPPRGSSVIPPPPSWSWFRPQLSTPLHGRGASSHSPSSLAAARTTLSSLHPALPFLKLRPSCRANPPPPPARASLLSPWGPAPEPAPLRPPAGARAVDRSHERRDQIRCWRPPPPPPAPRPRQSPLWRRRPFPPRGGVEAPRTTTGGGGRHRSGLTWSRSGWWASRSSSCGRGPPWAACGSTRARRCRSAPRRLCLWGSGWPPRPSTIWGSLGQSGTGGRLTRPRSSLPSRRSLRGAEAGSPSPSGGGSPRRSTSPATWLSSSPLALRS